MMQLLGSVAILASLRTVCGFVVVKSQVVVATLNDGARMMTPIDLTSKSDILFFPDAVMTMTSTSLMTADGAIDIVKSVALGIGIIGGLLFGLGFIFSTWLIPEAARQLEEQAKLVDPALWQEYEKQLGPGENLTMRPDLIQALGEKIQQKMAADFEAAMARQEQAKTTSSGGSSTLSNSMDNGGIIDATIISKDETKMD